MSMSVETLTQSINIALTDEYLKDIERGKADVYSQDGSEVRVAEWDDGLLEKPSRRFRIKIEEVEV